MALFLKWYKEMYNTVMKKIGDLKWYKEMYNTIMKKIGDDGSLLKVVQRNVQYYHEKDW